VNARGTGSNSEVGSQADVRVAALTDRIMALELEVELLLKVKRLRSELSAIRLSIRPGATAAKLRQAAKRTETLAEQVDALDRAVDAVSLLDKLDARLAEAEALLEQERGAGSREVRPQNTRRLREARKIIAGVTVKLTENAKWIADQFGLLARHKA
jgi:hypothetical protein